MAHAGGRPTIYEPSMVDKVGDYLLTRKDVVRQVLKSSGKGGESYEEKVVVSLPTLEGLSTYLGVNKSTLYEWEALYPQFSDALEKVRKEQHERLLDNGLAGTYNSTIAKLILSSNHGYVERKDQTTNGKEMPQPILNVISENNSNKQDHGSEEKNQSDTGGVISKQDNLDTPILDCKITE